MSIGKRLRFEILKRDGFRCAYCGASPTTSLLHVDHIEPVSKGGTDDPVNLIAACTECNLGKSNIGLDESQIEPLATVDAMEERTAQVRAYIAMLREFEAAKAELKQFYVNVYCDALGCESMPGAIAKQFVSIDAELGHVRLREAIAAVGSWAGREYSLPTDTAQTKYFFAVVRNMRERHSSED